MWFRSNAEEDWEYSPIVISSIGDVGLSAEVEAQRVKRILKAELEKHFNSILGNNTMNNYL